jgi:hypothetical protein
MICYDTREYGISNIYVYYALLEESLLKIVLSMKKKSNIFKDDLMGVLIMDTMRKISISQNCMKTGYSLHRFNPQPSQRLSGSIV